MSYRFSTVAMLTFDMAKVCLNLDQNSVPYNRCRVPVPNMEMSSHSLRELPHLPSSLPFSAVGVLSPNV